LNPIDVISLLSHIHFMPQLIVRNLDEELVRQLKKRAGEHGVSAEEEHRRILRATLLGECREDQQSFKSFLMAMPDFDDDSLFERDKSIEGRATSNNLFTDE
jgi:hypothetical protein